MVGLIVPLERFYFLQVTIVSIATKSSSRDPKIEQRGHCHAEYVREKAVLASVVVEGHWLLCVEAVHNKMLRTAVGGETAEPKLVSLRETC